MKNDFIISSQHVHDLTTRCDNAKLRRCRVLAWVNQQERAGDEQCDELWSNMKQTCHGRADGVRTHPHRTMAAWDRLLNECPVVRFAGSLAHAR